MIYDLQATDADEGAYGQVLYSLHQPDVGPPLFSLSTDGDGSAVVRLSRPLDYEASSVHEVRVIARDRAPAGGRVNSATAHLLVHVEDVDDTAPHFLTQPRPARLAEDAQIGSSVAQVRAVDGDRGVDNSIR